MKRTLILIALILSFMSARPAIAVHDDTSKTKCLDCHVTLPFDRNKLSYTETVGTICRKCHQQFPCSTDSADEGFSHPIEVQPTMSVPIDMPLDEKGRLSCITCHSYHAEFWDSEYNTEALLRRSKGPTLCYTCHKKL